MRLQINIDGLPISKSLNGQFWPTLGMIDNCRFKEPFIRGLFYGTLKPCNHEFLHDFINDVHSIEEGFAYQGKISAFIYDAPARSFIKKM